MQLKEIVAAIDRLSPAEREQVRQHLATGSGRGRSPDQVQDAKERIAALEKAVQNFWQGFTPTEVNEITAAMNGE